MATNEERNQKLRRTVAQKTGLPETGDSYFFLIRIGGNYDTYPFRWEPFRDLAGGLKRGTRSLPIVVISEAEERNAPDLLRSKDPFPHYELRVSPTVPVEAIANTWLELLADNRALHNSDNRRFGWFTGYLNITADQLSEKARKFIGM